ncbi:Nucleolar protein [Ooceraea biroi]|uniref:Nucleolar protein 56 n=1 Tax=Ooceraea biroi TaxID=2015173 RepID=A0A026VUP7_OOCBI|nr:Nucleolar protein [Ooceraea biroi]
MLLPQVKETVKDLLRFRSVVTLVGFAPFKTAVAALENINSISEGIITEDLKIFLDSCLPESTKQEIVILGVADPKLGVNINEALGIKCDHLNAVPEIIRGIRFHFHNLVKGFTPQTSTVSQLGLGHSYSRAKVKFNVNRVDNMIIQSISLLDQLDKDINTFSMRLREWYGYHFPELVKIDAEIFAERIISLTDYRRKMSSYLGSKMSSVAPNLATLIGDQVGARLIAHAGSLTNLAKAPSSTLQILGAEKALFRALKSRGKSNTPKYGLLFHSTFIGRAIAKDKGRIARFLANKCSLASRIDCFGEIQTSIFGEKLRQQVEERLEFFTSGKEPKKNIDAMREALEETRQMLAEQAAVKKKSDKRKRSDVLENGLKKENGHAVNGEADTSLPKKKKKKSKGTTDK